jgi:hypothetical protein
MLCVEGRKAGVFARLKFSSELLLSMGEGVGVGCSVAPKLVAKGPECETEPARPQPPCIGFQAPWNSTLFMPTS